MGSYHVTGGPRHQQKYEGVASTSANAAPIPSENGAKFGANYLWSSGDVVGDDEAAWARTVARPFMGSHHWGLRAPHRWLSGRTCRAG